MKALGRVLAAIVGGELLVAVVLFGLRLGSTGVSPPPVEPNLDAITGRELLALPDRFAFDSAAKWRTLGETYLVKGYFAKAEACLRRAQEADPRSIDVAYALGLCLESLGRIDDAKAAFHKGGVPGLKTGLVQVCLHHVGLLHLRAEQADEAVRAFEAAGDGYPPSVFERAKHLVRSGRAAEAGPLLETLAQAHPKDLHILFYRARAAEQLGREDEALSLYDEFDRGVPELDLDDAESFHRSVREGLGMAREMARAVDLSERGLPAAAAEVLTDLAADETRWENSYLFAMIDAAYYQVQAKQFAAARPLLERQLHDQQFTTSLVWELLGDVESAGGKPAEAWEAWSRAARIRGNFELHRKLASAAKQRGDETLSKQHLALAGLHGGIDQLRAGRFQDARGTLLKATAVDPQNPDVWFSLGECERLLGRPKEAEAAYRRCLKLKPHHGRAATRLAAPGK